jgi:hypothetical protein
VLKGKGKAILSQYKQEGENDLGELALFELTFAGLPGSLSGPAPPWSGTQFWYPQPSQPSQPSLSRPVPSGEVPTLLLSFAVLRSLCFVVPEPATGMRRNWFQIRHTS